jgi:hypothetical protein
MEVESSLSVVPWGVFLIFGEIVAIGVSPFEVAIDTTIRFVTGVE